MNRDGAMDSWGWNPASFEAVGTVAAAFIAVFALLATTAHERRRRGTEREQQKRRHAQGVSVLREDNRDQLAVTVRNDGPSPITAVSLIVRVLSSDGGEHIDRIRAAGDFEERSTRTWVAHRGVFSTSYTYGLVGKYISSVPPGKSERLVVVPWQAIRDGISLSSWDVGVHFTDIDGNQWTRSVDGTLLVGAALERGHERWG